MRRSSTGTDRVARSLALLLALVAIVSVTTAWLVNHHSEQQRAAVSDQLPPALITSAPAAPGPTSSPHPPASTAHPTKPAKPVTPKPIVKPIVPKHLYVPAIGVNTTISPKPTEQTNDPFIGKVVPSFGVPDDMYTTTWWSSGPRPGSTGLAVILGHTQIGGYGVFNNLAHLKAGEAVGVTRGATTLRFEVMSVRTGISKTDPTALQTVLTRHPAQARLALLTCSGDFNGGFRESAENTVVFARLLRVTH